MLHPGKPGEPKAAAGHEVISPPSFHFRPYNTLVYRLPTPAARAFPTLAPQPLPPLALRAGLN